MPIVQVNPAYLGTVYAVAPSEKNLLYGLGHSILASVQQVMLGFGASTAAATGGATLIAGAEASLGAGVISGLAASAQPLAIGMAQFGTSVFMNLATSQSGYTSVSVDPTMQGLGVCTPVELAAYLNDVTTGPFAAGGGLALLLAGSGLQFDSFTMTIAEATAFFAVYTDATGPFPPGAPNWIVPLSQTAAAYGVAAAAGDSTTMASMAGALYGTTGSGVPPLRPTQDALALVCTDGRDRAGWQVRPSPPRTERSLRDHLAVVPPAPSVLRPRAALHALSSPRPTQPT